MAVGHVQVNHAVPEGTSPSGAMAKAVYRAWDWYNTLGFVADQTCSVQVFIFFFSINIVLWTCKQGTITPWDFDIVASLLFTQISSARHGISLSLSLERERDLFHSRKLINSKYLQGRGVDVGYSWGCRCSLPLSAIQITTMTCSPQGPISSPTLQGSIEGPIN